MNFRGNIIQGGQVLLTGVSGEIRALGTAGGNPRWEGKFEVPVGAGIGPGPYRVLTDDGKTADIEVINQVDQRAGRTRVAYFRCSAEPQ